MTMVAAKFYSILENLKANSLLLLTEIWKLIVSIGGGGIGLCTSNMAIHNSSK